MVQTRIITPKVANGFVSRQFNLGVDSYDLDELYSPDTDQWKSKILHLGSPKYPPQVSTAPTRYWFDRSRYNNHGTITGATWEQLPSGVWAMNFDGSDDYVDTGAALTDGLAAVTVIVWFKAQSVPATQTLFGNYSAAANVATTMDINADGTIPTIIKGDNNALSSLTTADTYTVGKWCCAALTWDGATHRICIDGRESISAAYVDTQTEVSVTVNFTVGAYRPGVFQNVDAIIGEIAVYRRAFSVSEYREYYLATKWKYS